MNEVKDKYVKSLRSKMREYMQSGNTKRVSDIKQQIAKTIGTVILIIREDTI